MDHGGNQWRLATGSQGVRIGSNFIRLPKEISHGDSQPERNMQKRLANRPEGRRPPSWGRAGGCPLPDHGERWRRLTAENKFRNTIKKSQSDQWEMAGFVSFFIQTRESLTIPFCDRSTGLGLPTMLCLHGRGPEHPTTSATDESGRRRPYAAGEHQPRLF